MRNTLLFTFLVIGTFLYSAPTMGQELIRAASTWQVSSRCSLSISQENVRREASKPLLDNKCYGIAVSKGTNYNIHFYASHPSSEKPIISFVMAEGPFRGEHPVETSVLLLGQKGQISLPIDGGKCRLVNNDPRFAIAQCTSTTETQPDGTYLLIIATSALEKPVAPRILAALE
jgi:hypothetical protein